MSRETRPPKLTLTLDDVQAMIEREYFFTATQGVAQAQMDAALEVDDLEAIVCEPIPSDLGRLTVCVLVLKGGHLVTGESMCLNLEDFDAQIGIDEARKVALEKVWALLAFDKRRFSHLINNPKFAENAVTSEK